MAKHVLYGMVIAATALTSLPVLAQSATDSGKTMPPAVSAHTAANSSTTMTSPAASPTPRATTSSATSSAPTYYTADHQLRASKLVGASVYNDQDQSIGSVSDILLSDADHKAGTAVISVGGFLGVGSKLVTVPFDQIKVQGDKVVMPGVTKASLESMPDFDYNKA